MAFRVSPVVSMSGLLLLCLAQPLYATGYLTSYGTGNYMSSAVYKTVDSDGKVTYSTSLPRDSVSIQQITIIPGPADEYVEDTRQRLDRIRQTAQALTEAREKREAQRDKAAKERLERLALQRSARPQVYETKVYVGWNPLWWPRKPRAHFGSYPQKPASTPHHRPGLYSDRPVRRGINLR